MYQARTAPLDSLEATVKASTLKPAAAAAPAGPVATAEPELPLTYFDNGNNNTLRPVIFRPTGSFRVLKENGKMSCEPNELDAYKGRIKNPLADTQYFLPGYTGFVRGRQHVSGRTFGETTRRANATEYRGMACQSPIPSSPQANRNIEQKRLPDTFIESMFGGRQYMLPGYTGFVPGVRSMYGSSYGQSTQVAFHNHAENHPRSQSAGTEREGYARTAFPRQLHTLDSNPLPGGATTHQSPEMFIPGHIKYLRYLAQ